MDVTHHRLSPWRSSRSSLARTGDRIEAVVLTLALAGGLVAVGAGVWAGQAMAAGLAAHGAHAVVDAAGGEAPPMSAAPLAVGVVTVLLAWLLLAMLWLATEAALARSHASALEAEWARVEPRWSGRSA